MKKYSFLKKLVCAILISLQCAMITPAIKVFAAQDNTTDLGWSELGFTDEEDLKAKIIKDPVFIKAWAYHAYQLGFIYCQGTNTKEIGKGFDFDRKVENGKPVYYLKAHYNKNDKYNKHGRSDERLTMKISNVRFVMDPSTLKFGEAKVTEEKPLVAASKELMNGNNVEESTTINFNYSANTSVSRIDNYKFSEKIGLKVGFEAELPLIAKSKIETSLEFSAEQGWSSTKASTTIKSLSSSYTGKVPGKSKRFVELISIQRKSEVPYTAKMYMEYDIDLTGIVTKINAFKDHPQDFPVRTVTYGGKGLSAGENLLDIYRHRDINGYSNIDWKWLFKHRKQKAVEKLISVLSRLRIGGILTGKFVGFDGTHTTIKAHSPKPLTRDELVDLDCDEDMPKVLPLLSEEKMQNMNEASKNVENKDDDKNEVSKGIKIRNFKKYDVENITVHS